MIPSPPALLLNQIHLASTATLVIRDPSRAELGLAAGHGGILPPSPTRSGPSCFYSFVFLHFLEEQGEAQALKAAFVQRGGPRGTIMPPRSRRVRSGRNCLHLSCRCVGQALAPGTPQRADPGLCPCHLLSPPLNPRSPNPGSARAALCRGAQQGYLPPGPRE